MKRFTILLSIFVWVFAAIGQNHQIDPQDLEKMNRDRELQYEQKKQSTQVFSAIPVSKPNPFGPPATRLTTLNYDGENDNAIGLTDGGNMIALAHFTTDLTAPLAGQGIIEVHTYISDIPTGNYILKVYESGTTAPGAEIYSQDVTSGLVAESWNVFTLTDPVILSGSDIFVGVSVDHLAGQYPIGTDAGPANFQGDWASLDGGATWEHVGDFGFGNWNIRALVDVLADPAAPGAPTVLEATPADLGVLEVSLAWTNPTLSVAGETLTELDNIFVYRGTTLIETITEPVIGGAETFVDNTVAENGFVTYSVWGDNTIGNGIPASVTVFVGEDVPSTPSNVVLTANGNNGALSWDAPTEGLNDGYLSGADLTYTVVRLPDLVPVAEDISETSFEDTTVPSIGNYQYAVTASNLIGEGGTAFSNAVLLGAEGYLLFEGFEESWPPLGWVNSGWELSSWGGPHTGEEFAYSNLAGSTLNTPAIEIPAEGVFELSFFLRAESVNYPQDFNLNISVDGGAFENLLTYTGYTNAVYEEVNVGLDEYVGQTIIMQFEGLSGTGGFAFGILIDDVAIYEVYENDLAGVSITGNTTPSEGMETTYSITVGNFGYATQDTYTVKLMQQGGVELGSVAGTALAYGETATFAIAWTPTITDIGSTFVYGVVELASDEATGNNQTVNLNVTVQSSDIIVVTIGTGTNYPNVRMPFDFYWKNSLSQTIYYADELGVGGGVLTSISYTNNFETDLPGKDVQIWIGETAMESLTDGWVDPASLTLVYDGPLDFPIGENSIFIELDEPYIYGGGNLVVYSYRVWEDDYFSSSDRFYGTEDAGSGRTLRAVADSDVYNPTTPPEGATSDWHPNTAFFFSTAGLGALEGTVTDGVDPVEGVIVKVLGTSSTTTTDADGFYEFPYLMPSTYNIEFSLFGYETTVVEGVEILEEETSVADATITAIPTFTVSGTVVGNDELDLEGAMVTLEGYDDYSAVTDATGAFSITDVYQGTYLITISAVGYDTYTDAALLVEADVVLDPTLNETIIEPFAVMVDVDGQDAGNALLSWNSGESSFADSFEDGTFDAWEAFIQGAGTPGEGGNPYWFATDDPDGGVAPDGSFVARADWGYDIDTWLISPLIAVEAGTSISFEWYSSYYWSVDPNPNAELMLKISTDGGITWDEVWNWQNIGVWDNFTWYNSTFELTDYVGQAVHVAINLVGDDNAVTEIDNVMVGLSGKTGTFALTNPFAVAQDAKSLPAGLKAEKAFVGFNVFLDDAEVATEIAETSYLFEDLAEGDYTAGVQSVYSTGTSAIITTDFSIVFGVTATITVTTNSGDSPEGAVVTLTNQDNEAYVYTHTVAADGIASFESVRKGMYTMYITHDNFHDYVMTDVSIMDAFTHSAELVEIIEAPYGLMVETEGLEPDEAHFSWNNAPEVAMTESFETGAWSEGWSQIITNTGSQAGFNSTWHIAGTVDLESPITPQDGDYQAFMMWSYDHQDEWLITPEFSAPAGDLVFWYYGTNGSVNADNYYVKVSTDGGENWTILWNASELEAGENPYATPAVIDLSAYAGQDIHIAWNNVDGPTNDGVWYAWAIDNISIGGEKIDVRDLMVGSYPQAGNNNAARDGKFVKPVTIDGMNYTLTNKAFVGFNVFLNDVQVATDISETNHMFTDLPGGTHTAGVQSVYTSGTSAIEEMEFTVEGIFVPENFPVTFTVTDDTEGYEALRIKGSMTDPEWMDVDLVAGDNNVWSVTIEEVAPGSYEWGITEDDGTEFGVWLLPPGNNLMFTVGEDGTITGDVSYTLLVDDTSVDNLFADNISMFPNPASDIITLRSGINMKEVKLLDISGRVVYASTTLSNEHSISVRSFESGIYFVQIFTSEGILTGKLQVQK